ncbi:hypothetical protein H9Q70_006099 [Fusarium xylarioides]|nr:hypothetical protein H9Q70_006099 [Fusarium xylarioides]
MDIRLSGITMNLVDLAGLSDVVKVITGKAADSLSRLKEEGKLETVDMLFLDHVEDLRIVADNVLRPGAPEYKQYVKEHKSMETRAIMGLIIPGEFEDEIEVTEYKV